MNRGYGTTVEDEAICNKFHQTKTMLRATINMWQTIQKHEGICEMVTERITSEAIMKTWDPSTTLREHMRWDLRLKAYDSYLTHELSDADPQSRAKPVNIYCRCSKYLLVENLFSQMSNVSWHSNKKCLISGARRGSHSSLRNLHTLHIHLTIWNAICMFGPFYFWEACGPDHLSQNIMGTLCAWD